MRKSIILFSCLMIIGGLARAEKYAGEAFSLGVGARGLALGGAVVAGPFDASAPYFNPAGMNHLQGQYVMAMHAETFGSLLNHDFVSYINSYPRPGSFVKSFGFYLYYLGGGGIKITEVDRFDRFYVVREESHGDWLLAAVLGGTIGKRLDIGLSAKVIYRDIGTETGRGLTMDAGLLWQIHRKITLGLMIADVTTGFIRYSGATFDQPASTETINPTIKPGINLAQSYFDWTVSVSASGDIRFENIKYAAEYWTGPVSLDTHYGCEINFRDIVFGRAGLDLGRLTAGGGVDVRNITIDFADLHHGDLEETFRGSAG